MNIFVFSLNPKKCAAMHCDKHVVKMILEYAQLLCTAHRICDPIDISSPLHALLYKKTHTNHPAAIWTRASRSNYRWLYLLWKSLCKEYTRRYSKIHKTYTRLRKVLHTPPSNMDCSARLSLPPKICPSQYHVKSVTKTYINYFINEKQSLAHWRAPAAPPSWYHS